MPAPKPAARLPCPYRDEAETVATLMRGLHSVADWPATARIARPWVQAVRDKPAPFWAMESLLREYPISSAEGLALMRLAEALLRVPDAETAIALTADQLGKADFDAASGGPHQLLASISSSAIALSKKLLPGADNGGGLLQRIGAHTVVAATVRAIQLLGRQFVLGRSIDEAMAEATSARQAQAVSRRSQGNGNGNSGDRDPGLRFSYDMLGEGARTEADAERYLASYLNAVAAIGGGRVAASPERADGISIKLSALFSRFEETQRDRVFDALLPRVWRLIDAAAGANINLTIDAEESDRLELSLDVFEALAQRIAVAFPQWRGFGLAVQAYQTRALQVVDEVARIARATGLRFMVRLVKGAYWDSEIKRAQEMGLAGYPVFTHKQHTDISYLACAHALIGHADVIYPQFATHNAGTIAAIVGMAQATGAAYEMQRLHGMGEAVYREVMRHEALASESAATSPLTHAMNLKQGPVPVRVYAPVGEHRDLLAYLVRRLLENGANSSFVHQLSDETVTIDTLLASPLVPEPQPGIAAPAALYRNADGSGRLNSRGFDLACLADRAQLDQAIASARVPVINEASPGDVDAAMGRLQAGFAAWAATPLAQRVSVLRRAADALQMRLPEFCGLLVAEAHKTLGDCVSEVREAIDFCRYYADQAEQRLGPQTLPGPTGESNVLQLHGRGVFVCISPWNFPLAIFAGQVVAALVAGNAVAAKPAEQTPAVALAFVELLFDAGLPRDALALLHGPGETTGTALVADRRVAGVCFTGSTAVARHINRALAAKDGPIVPLIAETGGINAMIVDSSALAEQVVDAVVQSAFRSTGQRCSALRLLCVHAGMADGLLEMLRGAMRELQVGDPARLSTDVGPVIDDEAFRNLKAHIARLRSQATLVGEAPLDPDVATAIPRLIAPIAFELPRIADVSQEVFGPVLHIVRWSGSSDAMVAQINALGYGLTLGIQTRIDSRALRLASQARVGNVYINRNMIGAVVGVQPFGGEGLSGTGPKAGGPNYLPRFCAEQTVTINTAAAGGNAALLAGAE